MDRLKKERNISQTAGVLWREKTDVGCYFQIVFGDGDLVMKWEDELELEY